MKHFRKNGGFTLVELMVSILVGTLITGAAVTVLLLGLRIHKSSTDTASRQNTTRIVLTVMENLAEEGKITDVDMENYDWKISANGTVLMSYSFDMQKGHGTIYTGSVENKNVMLDNVLHSYVELNEKGLLTFSIENEDGAFSSSVYCRTAVISASGSADLGDDAVGKGEADNVIDDAEKIKDTSAARAEFLKVLLTQKDRKIFGITTSNPGLILDDNGVSTGKYYTEWYIGTSYSDDDSDSDGDGDRNGWNENTPWCAAYISWCLNRIGDAYVTAPTNRTAVDGNGSRWYANVDTFWEEMRDASNGIGTYCTRIKNFGDTYIPTPGDLVFFDWIINAEENPQHMGVVLSVSGDTIFTIEGNTAGRVALRKYAVSDERILGYGVLNWK